MRPSDDPLADEEVLDAGDGDLRLRDLWEIEIARSMSLVVVLFLFGTALGVYHLVTETPTGSELTVVVAGTVVLAWLALDHLDRLDCLLREEHTCRHCARENERWAAIEAVDHSLTGRLARIVRKLSPRRG